MCAKIREVAEKAQIKAHEIVEQIKVIIAKGIVKAKEIIEKIKEKLFPAFEDEGNYFSVSIYHGFSDVIRLKML